MRRLALLVVTTLVAVVLAPPVAAAPDWTDHATAQSFDQGGRRTVVLDVRYAAHRGFDRVVVDLSGPLPDHNLRYIGRFVYEGSGEPIPIRGRSGIMLVMLASDSRADGTVVYRGPRIARPGLSTLRAMAVSADSEGVFALDLALRHRAPYRVALLTSPPRLVVDLRHR